MNTLAQLGEDALITSLCQNLPGSDDLLIGPGDDCAVIGKGENLTLLKTDAIIEGVHFEPQEDPKRIGWKAVARVLSDFAAMAGTPRELLITIALNPQTEVTWVHTLYQGIKDCLAQHGGIIVGGETSSLPDSAPTIISIAGRGHVKKSQLVTRSGGQAHDSIYVTGTLGGSIHGKHLDFSPRLKEAHWLSSHFHISAMMDLSDGLAKDLTRLARMSRCGFTLDLPKLPLTPGSSAEEALNDGEDYELLFTSSDCIEKTWQNTFPHLPLTQIGTLTSEKEKNTPLQGGWDHFQR